MINTPKLNTLPDALEWALSRIEPMNRGDYWEKATAILESARATSTPQAANIPVEPSTWSATVLQYSELREGHDVDKSFMDYYMGGGQMVHVGQEIKLFITDVTRKPGCVWVTMDWHPVRQSEDRAAPPADPRQAVAGEVARLQSAHVIVENVRGVLTFVCEELRGNPVPQQTEPADKRVANAIGILGSAAHHIRQALASPTLAQAQPMPQAEPAAAAAVPEGFWIAPPRPPRTEP